MTDPIPPSPCRMARRAAAMNPPGIREILKLTEQPGVISFAGGLPAPASFPVEEMREACARVLADALLLAAVASAAIGYVAGARLSAQMRAEQVICWVLVASLPVTLPAMLAAWPAQDARASAWGGFAYVTLFSMWLGFFAWYRGLALGGTVRVSQVQLVQPFLALLAAVPLLGERLDAATVVFSLAVVATVFLGKRMPVDSRGVPAS